MVVFKAGAGNAITGTSEPVISLQNSAGTQVGMWRGDGLVASALFATIDDATAGFGQGGGLVTEGLNLRNSAFVTFSSDGFWYGTKDLGINKKCSRCSGNK
jgi:hypothetical protein